MTITSLFNCDLHWIRILQENEIYTPLHQDLNHFLPAPPLRPPLLLKTRYSCKKENNWNQLLKDNCRKVMRPPGCCNLSVKSRVFLLFRSSVFNSKASDYATRPFPKSKLPFRIPHAFVYYIALEPLTERRAIFQFGNSLELSFSNDVLTKMFLWWCSS